MAEYRRRRSRSGSSGSSGSSDSGDSSSCGGPCRLPMYEESNLAHREDCYDEALADMGAFLSTHEDGVAVLDAVCTTHQWRLKIRQQVQRMGVKLVFVEVQNNDPLFLQSQVELVAARSPDYKVRAWLC